MYVVESKNLLMLRRILGVNIVSFDGENKNIC